MAMKNPPQKTVITSQVSARLLEWYYSGKWVNITMKDGRTIKRYLVIGDDEFYDDEKGCYYEAIVVNDDGDIFNCDETIRFNKIKEVELVEASNSNRE